MSSVCHRKLVKFSLITSALILWLQQPATAQATFKEQQTSNKATVSQSDSVPTQLTTPNTFEQRRYLLLRLKLRLQSFSPNISSQNIHLLLRLNQKRLYIYRGNVLQASYPVAIGKPKWETPTGKFKVIHMVENPTWENPFVSKTQIIPPGSDNPLGERWIGFWTDGKDEIGFHGTYQRNSVGKAVSHGCVRLYNEDVRKLYTIVTIGTPVTVVP